jgi:hypothetical protein
VFEPLEGLARDPGGPTHRARSRAR